MIRRALDRGAASRSRAGFTKVKNLRVVPKPLQKPTPPIYVACTFTPQSFEWTGRQGSQSSGRTVRAPGPRGRRTECRPLPLRVLGVRPAARRRRVLRARISTAARTRGRRRRGPARPMMRYLGQFSESTRDAEHSEPVRRVRRAQRSAQALRLRFVSVPESCGLRRPRPVRRAHSHPRSVGRHAHGVAARFRRARSRQDLRVARAIPEVRGAAVQSNAKR